MAQCPRIRVTFLSVFLLFICHCVDGQGSVASSNGLRLNQAALALDSSRYDLALGLYQQAHRIADSLHLPEQSAIAWLGEANCRLEHADPPSDLPQFLLAFDTAIQHTETPLDQLRMLTANLRLQVLARNQSEAQAVYAQLHALRARLHRIPALDLATALVGEAEYFYMLNAYTESIEAFLRGIKVIEAYPGQRKLLAIAYREISLAYHDLHNFDLELAFARKAVNLAEIAFGIYHDQTARAYSRIGNTYVVKEMNVEALDNYLRASKICRKVFGNDHPRTLKSYNGLANVYHNLGDSARAVQYYLRALHGSWVMDGDSSAGAQSAYRNLGIHYFDCKQFDLARYYWTLSNKVEAFQRGTKSKVYVEQLTWIGETWSDQGHHEKATSVFDLAVKLLAPGADTSDHFRVPNIRVEANKKRTLAILALEKGQNFLNQHKKEGGIKQLEAALNFLEYGLSSFDSIRVGYHGNLAQFAILDFSYQFYEIAIDAARRLYLASRNPIWLERAFGYMERSKSTLLNSAIRTASLGDANSEAVSWKEQETMLHQRIDELDFKLHQQIEENTPAAKLRAQQLKDELLAAQQDLQYYLSDLSTCNPEYFNARYSTMGPSISQVQAKIGNGAFVEYFIGEDTYFIFVLTAEKAQIVQKPIAGLDAAVEGFLSKFTPKQVHQFNAKADFLSSAQLLYAYLIDPIANLLPPKGRLVIAPDGKLGHVPFEALVRTGVQVQPGATYASFPYLMRDHVIGYASSADALLNAQANGKTQEELRMLAFAPDFDQEQPMLADAGRSSLSTLRHAQEEVKHIVRYVKGDIVSGHDATEARFKASAADYNILHFATHGTFDDENPLWSGIEFARDGNAPGDGTLHTMELFAMNLDVEMAVLSACNTGRGKLVNGEGIMSLARGFMYAGCPSIVMSLYAVDDAATSTIMEGFYKSLSKGHDKDQALRASKEEYLRNTPDDRCHPYYWAAHVLIGAHEGFPAQKQGLTWILILAGILFVFLYDELRKM